MLLLRGAALVAKPRREAAAGGLLVMIPVEGEVAGPRAAFPVAEEVEGLREAYVQAEVAEEE